ncbi:hypothetical protein DPMN_100082 [Dreissena polymorpha]|uniref:Uncharacterized protein n=1 Tax=Dreissena polymorpha TaxID=45954 RepID=A0A9D4R8T1_DREPO|nr:hypothetical protein DPMN_100082 [Dreissena polymorpha]
MLCSHVKSWSLQVTSGANGQTGRVSTYLPTTKEGAVNQRNRGGHDADRAADGGPDTYAVSRAGI